MGKNKRVLFDWLGPEERAAGVLLHPTSLPGDLGIGKFGREAYRFVDFLVAAGMRHWQLCPLGPTGYGDSPYQCFSAFAGNPYLIDLYPLAAEGLVSKDELISLQRLSRDKVDYGGQYERLWPVLRAASERFIKSGAEQFEDYGDYTAFQKEHADWLEPYAAFSAAKEHFGGKPWNEWPKSARHYTAFQKSALPGKLTAEMESVRFLQYLFYGQWVKLRAYAAERGISIIGDAPIFVAYDSADVWASPDLFQLKADGSPRAVAGVPPDYFSATGQLWGNPLYDWDKSAEDGYAWWKARLASNFTLFDIIRLDHFRGFASYWSIPADAPDARPGKWVDGPGLPFFEELAKAFPEGKIIAEDLGEITSDVIELMQACGLPGMAVLQFAFGDPKSIHLPHNHQPNQVVYPGTHDNNTTIGWYKSVDDRTRDHLRRYLCVDGREVQWDLVRAAYKSPARLAVVPLQDLLNLDSEARLNMPGSAAGNWQWRYSTEQLDKLWHESASYLKELADLYGRLQSLS